MQVSKTVNDDKQGFWLERIFLEKERSSKRTMVFDIGRKNIKMKLTIKTKGTINKEIQINQKLNNKFRYLTNTLHKSNHIKI